MWIKENAGQSFNKAETKGEGLAAMAATRDDGHARSFGSWEMKCCNISAVMNAAGLDYIPGYKPLGNAQAAPLVRALLWAADNLNCIFIARTLRRHYPDAIE